MLLHWYSSFVVRYYHLVIFLVLFLFGIATSWLMLHHHKPDFTDPRRGFETRHTKWANRITAWSNIARALKHLGPLVRDPSQDPESSFFVGAPATASSSEAPIDYIEDDLEYRPSPWHVDSARDDGHFCGSLLPVYGRAVFSARHEHDANASLMSLPAVLSLCHLERRLHTRVYSEACQRRVGSTECCRAWSLPAYLTLLTNGSSCAHLRQAHLDRLVTTLTQCRRFYDNGRLHADCAGALGSCSDLPAQCTRHNAVYNLMHYILDRQYGSDSFASDRLSYASVYLPMAYSGATQPYFNSLPLPLQDSHTRLVGVGFNLRGALFDQYLVGDAVYLALAASLILLLMCCYTRSLLVTSATVSAVLMALAGAYCLYTAVLRIAFFPFMNVLAAVIAVAVGADDTFILCSTWRRLRRPQLSLQRVMHLTLADSAVSMVLTSVTTAAAFFASGISSVTAIACFSIYAGLTIMLNLALMLTWVPAFIVLSERSCAWLRTRLLPSPTSTTAAATTPTAAAAATTTAAAAAGGVARRVQWLVDRVQCADRFVFTTLLLDGVVRLRRCWLLVLGGAGLASAVIVLYWPGLRLPTTSRFRLLSDSHLIEVYDSRLAAQFRFHATSADSAQQYRLVLSFVWGVRPVDTGHALDPDDRGQLVLDPEFDLSSPEAQQWLYDFCADLRRQRFYRSTQGPLLSNCIVETLRRWMEGRRCEAPSDGQCCNHTSFPYSPRVFRHCLLEAVASLYRTPAELRAHGGQAGAVFRRGGRSPLAAVIVEYESELLHAVAPAEMARQLQQVEQWLHDRLASAPPGLRAGWLVTDVEMFDLQRALATETLHALALALLLSALLLAVGTHSLRLAALAAVTIATVVVSTLAVLVALGWRLNVLESVAVTVTIGLSLDFTMHYCVAYRTATLAYRQAADTFNDPATTTTTVSGQDLVRRTLGLVGSPVAMAALSSLTAGVCMLPSTVLAYVQMGVFLVVLTSVSWLFATFFFLPLLCVFGRGHLQLQRQQQQVSSQNDQAPRVKSKIARLCHNCCPSCCCSDEIRSTTVCHTLALVDIPGVCARSAIDSTSPDHCLNVTQCDDTNINQHQSQVPSSTSGTCTNLFPDPPPSPIIRMAMR